MKETQIIKDMIKRKYEAMNNEKQKDEVLTYSENKSDFLDLNRYWEVDLSDEIVAYSRLYEKVIVLFKKLVQKIIGWYIKPFTHQQKHFNGIAVRTINQLKQELHDTKLSLDEKTKLINQKQREIDSINERLDNLENLNNMNYDTIEFMDKFRGSREEILKRLEAYIPYIKSQKKALDIGCGRGEMLEIFNRERIESKGIDLNDQLVQLGKAKGFNIEKGNAVEYFKKTNQKVDLITMIHFIEHFHPNQIEELLKGAYDTLEVNGILIVETPNPKSLSIFRESFYLDPTHIRPVHPLLLEFVGNSIGFTTEKIIEFERVTVDERYSISPNVRETLFSARDYAIIFTKEKI